MGELNGSGVAVLLGGDCDQIQRPPSPSSPCFPAIQSQYRWPHGGVFRPACRIAMRGSPSFPLSCLSGHGQACRYLSRRTLPSNPASRSPISKQVLYAVTRRMGFAKVQPFPFGFPSPERRRARGPCDDRPVARAQPRATPGPHVLRGRTDCTAFPKKTSSSIPGRPGTVIVDPSRPNDNGGSKKTA